LAFNANVFDGKIYKFTEFYEKRDELKNVTLFVIFAFSL
jgi:hypothetical protein